MNSLNELYTCVINSQYLKLMRTILTLNSYIQLQSFIYNFYQRKQFQYCMQNQNQYRQKTVFQFLKQRLTLNIVSCDVFQKLSKDVPKSLLAKAFQILILQARQGHQSKEYLNILMKMQKNFKKKIIHLKKSCQSTLQTVEQVQNQFNDTSKNKERFLCTVCEKKRFKSLISCGVHQNKCQQKYGKKRIIRTRRSRKLNRQKVKVIKQQDNQVNRRDKITQKKIQIQTKQSTDNGSLMNSISSESQSLSIQEEQSCFSSYQLLDSPEQI